jgi:endonuclease/exonuclease/phosphatase family metal-dependent hydrolase
MTNSSSKPNPNLETNRQISAGSSGAASAAAPAPLAGGAPALSRVIRVMTYNVHSFIGTDHVYDPERIARVIEASGAELVALQEVDFGRGGQQRPAAIENLARRLSMGCHFTFTREGQRGLFGNAVLTAHPFQLVAEGMLPSRRGEARAVQWLRVLCDGLELQLMNTHLSVRLRERGPQIEALLGADWALRALQGWPLVICGDFNSSPLSRVYRRLSRGLQDVQNCVRQRRATWPSYLPFWRIDHIFVSNQLSVRSVQVLGDGLARVASDHLPVLAELCLTSGAVTCPVS